jgi:ribonuclease J
MISPPELIARGVGEDPDLVDELREEAGRIAAELSSNGLTEIKLVQEHIHDAIGQVVYDRTRRRPMILPVVIEV